MAGGFLGLPGLFGTSPMGALGAMPPESTAPSPSPAPAPAPPAVAPGDPATTGSVPGSTQNGGGAPSRGFGDVLSDMMSGKGIMGAQPGDDKVDPNTGATAGQMRQMSMQSMMGMGLTLLAAGMRQTDDSRAAILARAPAMLNNSDQLNNFAKMRLEMANARLKERQVQQAEAQQKGWQGLFRTGSGAAANATAAPTAPAAPVVGNPGDALPAPGGAPAAPMPTDATAAPVTPSGVPAVQPGAPVQTASGVQAQPASGEHPLLAGISPGVRQLLSVMPADEGMKKLLEIRQGLDSAEVLGNPYQDDKTGKWFVPKIKNGQKVGITELGNSREFAGAPTIDPDTGQKVQTFTRDGQTVRTDKLGDVPRPITVEKGDDGRDYQVTKNAAGQTISRTLVPEGREDPTNVARAKQYVDMEGEIRKASKEGGRMTGLLNDFQKAIDDPNVYFGPNADKVNGAKAIAKTLGMDVQGVDNANLATKVQNQLALMVRNPEGGFGGMPGSTSDRDVSFLMSSVPSLMTTREGAQLVKDTFQAMATRNIEIYKMQRQYIKDHGKLDVGFEDMVADKYDEPLLDEAKRKQIDRLAKAQAGNPAPAADPAAAAPAPAATAAGDVIDGYRYKGGPRGLESSWEKVK